MIARPLVLVTLLGACGDPPARVRLVPVDLGACGKPAAAAVRTIRVIAYAGDGEHPKAVPADATGAVSLADFPADTEQLGVVISGATGELAEGKSAPLAFDSLAQGTAIPIAVLPFDGLCATASAMQEARLDPLVASAGDGVLLVGGGDGTGKIRGTAEYYDRVTATFTAIPVPIDLGPDGFAGAAVTELSGGDVLITGPGHVALVFDPGKRAFVSHQPALPDAFAEERAFHAMREIDGGRVIVAGGCRGIAAGACDLPEASTFRYPLAELGTLGARDDGPVLGSATQDGARLYDLGAQLDGSEELVLAGGRSAPSVAETFDPDGTRVGTEVTGLHAQLAVLPGGALLSAFAPDGTSPPSGAAGVLAPGGAAVAPIGFAQALDGARVVALEDGSVLAVGGDPAGAIYRYLPTVDLWQPVKQPPAGDPASGDAAALPAQLAGPALARLADGSVLVAGGTVGGQPSTAAWLFRPSLVGASSGLVEAQADGTLPGVLVPSDPAATSHAGDTFVLTAPGGDLTARALIGGALTATGSVNALVERVSGGMALIAQQLGPGRALVGELVPGAPARIVRLDGGAATTRCQGQVVPAFPAGQTSVGLAVAGGTATLSVAGQTLAACDLAADPDASDRGAWGIAADGAGASVQVDTITVAR